MLEIQNTQVVYAMSPENAPVLRVPTGSRVLFHTLDCYSERLQSECDKSSLVPWEVINPATGPLYIEEAKAGDVLRVEIESIDIADHGVMGVGPGMGVLGGVITEEKTRIIPIRDGKAVFNDKIALPVKPMIGVIGTAPARESIPTGTPGEHGSNMDCNRIVAGSVLYLPVNVDGALLAMGDLHAVMGDGEIVICGVEISGKVTVKVDVIKNWKAPLPMLETEDAIICICSRKTLDEAAVDVTHNMAAFLQEKLGMEAYEAGMLLSAACNLRINQMVDPLMTVRMELPKNIAEAYGFRMP